MFAGSWQAPSAAACMCSVLSLNPAPLSLFMSSAKSGCDGSTGEEARDAGCLCPNSSDVVGATGRRAGMAGQERLVVVRGRVGGGALTVGLVVLVVLRFSLEGMEGREPEVG